jgi:hypothetical protein
MNDNAKKWVAALRSGEFTQATGQLQKHDSYCCLGVACVIAERSGNVRIHRTQEGIVIGMNLDDFQPDVLNWLGMMKSHDFDLSARNDNGWSFESLAKYIEDNL